MKIPSWLKLLPIAFLALLIAGCADKRPTGPTGEGGIEGTEGGDVAAEDAGNMPHAETGRLTKVTPENADYTKFAAIHFDYDSATIRSGDRKTLEEVAAWLKEDSGRQVLVAGHCDKRGTLEYNRALGQRRASAAREYLIKLGASANNVGTVSFGEEKPAADGDSESAFAENRRDEFGVAK